MKTFNKEDLITWANREKANTYEKYYFADSISGMQKQINNDKFIHMLIEIKDDRVQIPFISDEHMNYACILPVDAVKENKTYRACRTVKELYELIFNTNSKADDRFYINGLIGTVIHFRFKGIETSTSFYECITGIVVYINGDIAVHIGDSQFELPELFKNYEIELNGKWVPFGVLDDENLSDK